MRSAFAILFALVFFLLVAPQPATGGQSAQRPDPRPEVCGLYAGAAFTFCVALCETAACDRGPSDERCAALRRGFSRVTGGARPPCQRVLHAGLDTPS